MREAVRLLILLGALTAQPSILSAIAAEPVAREKFESRLSQAIRPVSDEEWNALAGPRTTESYEVVRGDTLYGISQRLFSDAKYWPKIWALNNGRILNAHRITPGMQLAFAPGSASTPPSLSVAAPEAMAAPAAVAATASPDTPVEGAPPARDRLTQSASSSGRSEEWKKLGPQRWESSAIEMPPTVDRFGFDQGTGTLRLREWPSRGMELETFPSTRKIESLGRVIGARRESSMLGSGDLIYIEPEAELQVGQTYTLTSEPELLKSPESDRSGWSYSVDGTVRILGVKDGIFLGRIETSRNGIFRQAEVVPVIPKSLVPSPIPGPGPIGAVLLLDPVHSATSAGQFRQVFVDRGSEDGVRPGMVFRAYQHSDPSTGREIFENDTVINGDILILRTSEQISLGIVLGSHDPLPEDSALVLLTDVSDVMTKAGFRPRTPEEAARDRELDDLEKIPPTDGMTSEEQKELEQLEGWKGNPPAVEKALEGKDLREISEGVENPDVPPPVPVDAEPSTEEEAPPANLAPEGEPSPAPTDELAPPPVEEEVPSEEPPPPPLEEEPSAEIPPTEEPAGDAAPPAEDTAPPELEPLPE